MSRDHATDPVRRFLSQNPSLPVARSPSVSKSLRPKVASQRWGRGPLVARRRP